MPRTEQIELKVTDLLDVSPLFDRISELEQEKDNLERELQDLRLACVCGVAS